MSKRRKALTPKQEKFCQSIVAGMNQSDAYRAAYDCNGMIDATINNEAYVLMKNPDISARIEKLKLPIAERLGMGLEDYLTKLITMRDKAKDDAHAIKAHELIGKCLGYYVTKTELTGKDGAPVGIKIEKTIVDPGSNT